MEKREFKFSGVSIFLDFSGLGIIFLETPKAALGTLVDARLANATWRLCELYPQV